MWTFVAQTGDSIDGLPPASITRFAPTEVLITDTDRMYLNWRINNPPQVYTPACMLRHMPDGTPTAPIPPGTFIPQDGTPGWRVRDSSFVCASDDVVMIGLALLPEGCTTGCDAVSRLYIMETDGTLTEVYRSGDGPTLGLLPNFVLQQINSGVMSASGAAVFNATLWDGGANYAGLVGWTREAGFFPVAVPGTQFEVAPGVYRTVSSASMIGRATDSRLDTLMEDDGSFLFNVSFSGGPGALYLGQVGSFSKAWYPCPTFIIQPQGGEVVSSSTLSLDASAAGDEPMTYQWQRNGVPLENGAGSTGVVVSGATTTTLVLAGVAVEDSGAYECIATNTCGSATSLTALVTVASACDPIDFNRDDLFPDTADIDDFLTVFSGGPCSNDPECGDIDFNNDGLFPDTADIDSLLRVFSGGPCT